MEDFVTREWVRDYGVCRIVIEAGVTADDRLMLRVTKWKPRDNDTWFEQIRASEVAFPAGDGRDVGDLEDLVGDMPLDMVSAEALPSVVAGFLSLAGVPCRHDGNGFSGSLSSGDE